jgi:hypothetical protein
MKPHAGQMEVAVANLINWRENTVVPNVSWGLGVHECDILVLDKQDRLTEIEIKVTVADMKADAKKEHGHKSKIISRLAYAFPTEILDKCTPLVPQGAGIIAVDTVTKSSRYPGLDLKRPAYKARWVRRCKHDPNKSPIRNDTARKLMHLGCMRIWSLKAHNNVKNETRTTN